MNHRNCPLASLSPGRPLRGLLPPLEKGALTKASPPSRGRGGREGAAA
jgi:hypothetical protein